MDRPLYFLAMMLQYLPDFRGASNVRTIIKQRIKEWTEGKFQMLVSSVDLSANSFMCRKRGVTTSTERTKIFSNLVFRGKMGAAIRYTCDWENGGVLMPDEIDETSGDRVRVVLQSKHTESRSVSLNDVPNYDTHSELLEILVTDENVENVTKSMSGSAGPNGVDSSAMSRMVLKHGRVISELRKSLAKF